jgi:hypothetical protein
LSKQAAAEKRLRERQAAGTKIPLYETQQQKVRSQPALLPPLFALVCRAWTCAELQQVAADLVSNLPYILPPVGVLILSLLGFAVFM